MTPPKPPTTPFGAPANYIINIAVDPPNVSPPGGSSGNFVYTPALLHVLRGDRITWTCNSSFTVMFKDRSPINQMTVYGDIAGAAGGFSTPAFEVVVQEGNFHYAVAVWNGSQVCMDAGCPGVSVN